VTDFFSRLKALSSNANAKEADASRQSNRHAAEGSSVDPAPSARVLRRDRLRSFRPFPEEWRWPDYRTIQYRRWLPWVLLGLVAGGAGMTAYSVRRTLYVMNRDLPAASEVETFARPGTLVIKADDGTILQQIGPATRETVSLDEIPPQLIEAFLASEDQNFYGHNGVDYRAIARAFWRNLTAREVVEGGSTITQQVARIVYLDNERSYERKLREAVLAHKIEEELGKDEVLEAYLNLVYLGSNAYGVADAAWIFFGKSVQELTLPEMALIAGLPPAPSVYSPIESRELAVQRRNIVLQRMHNVGFITQAEMEGAIATPLELNPKLPRNILSSTPFFTIYVQQQLPLYVPQEEIERGGLVVETTLNPTWQKYGEQTVRDAVNNYGIYERFSQASLVAIDPRNGEVKAMVGGTDFDDSQFNRATQAMRQPGSTFKSFVYATAIAAGFSPYRSYEDAPLFVDGYEPQNYGNTYRNASISLRDALIASTNVVAVKLLIDVGFEPTIQVAQKMGIQSDLIAAYSLSLGTSEVSLMELTSAYGTFANAGKHIRPHVITRVINREGEVIYQADFQAEQAIDPDTAAIMTWMLRGVVSSGTGAPADIGRPAAGKTGTSEERRDLWFVGYIPQLVTGVWLGNDDNSPTWGVSGTAALTWRNFMSQVIADIPSEGFPELPPLEGREAMIETQPVRPRRMETRSSAASSGESTPAASSRSAPSEESAPSSAQTYQEPAPAEPYYEPPSAPMEAPPMDLPPAESAAPIEFGEPLPPADLGPVE
jgi:penicillin-binding protein 1A